METTVSFEKATSEGWTDLQVIDQVKAGNTALYEIIMRRYNQRLYRAALSILRDPTEAEDVIQDAYVRAYQHLDQFAGRSAFSTWLTRIAINESLHRLKLRQRNQQVTEFDADEEESMNVMEPSLDPEQRASMLELGQLLEEAVLELPGQYRSVIMLRDIEELSTAETAAALELTEENVKIRLHRGHAMMRDRLYARVGSQGKAAFPFMGSRCDQVVRGVFMKLHAMEH
ncbi:RNA polymerase sigma factor [Edaphobacter sp. 12200R-103]|uniref:RNA polymerase sigma factor n=1 Tax=Edaphobacter sp. 12200R-103 TaxID=2703788 RepID=UPI00138B7839|nr:RNA polymerase sigma factor [Edaphobacter sp. 12200R-103]QHS52805.1 RNA polymerase sigma factor [Edaphobacter sp. 12200R-103]